MPSNLVFILGAGASKEAGVPTMINFLDTTDKIIDNLRYYLRLDNELEEAYSDVLETKRVLQGIYHKAFINLDFCACQDCILTGIMKLSKFRCFQEEKIW